MSPDCGQTKDGFFADELDAPESLYQCGTLRPTKEARFLLTQFFVSHFMEISYQ